jgi:CHAD domain-containing protein
MDSKAALLLLMNQRLATLIDAMPAAQAGDVRSVHQARVASRRLREALPVLRASVHQHRLGRVRRQVRRMSRALGPVRELDVALTHVEELATREIVSARALAYVRQEIARERLERRRELLAAITPGKIDKLRDDLGHVATGPETPHPAEAIEQAEQQVTRRARNLADAVQRASGLYLPDRLQRVRVAAKKLRYAMAVDRELRRSRSTARIGQLKRLQDVLGLMHDFEMLIDHTRRVQALIAAQDRALATELDAVVRTLEEECRLQHATYMRRRTSILRLCEALTTAQPTVSAVA